MSVFLWVQESITKIDLVIVGRGADSVIVGRGADIWVGSGGRCDHHHRMLWTR